MQCSFVPYGNGISAVQCMWHIHVLISDIGKFFVIRAEKTFTIRPIYEIIN